MAQNDVKDGSLAPGAVDLQAMAGVNNFVQHGLFVSADPTPDLNIRMSSGLARVSGVKVQHFGISADGTAVTVAAAGKEKVAIAQISNAGVVSIKYSTEVNLGTGLAKYPSPDANNILLANLFTPGTPILEGSTTIGNANIFNAFRDFA